MAIFMTIPDIKSRLSIQQVLSHYGFVLNQTNRLLCPWHEDKTPSLQIFPKTNSWTCFSSKCQAGSGDAIEFCVRMEGNKHRGIQVAESLVTGEASLTPARSDSGPALSRIAVLSKVAQESKAHFKKVAKARQYLQQRGLDLDKLEAAGMPVGYMGSETGKGWNEALQQSALQLGILRKSKNGKVVPAFRQCVLFFLKNAQDQSVGLYGRSIQADAGSKSGTGAQVEHLYLSGQHQGLYPHYPHHLATYLILTESVIDAATLAQHTDYQVLALYGTQGLTAEHQGD